MHRPVNCVLIGLNPKRQQPIFVKVENERHARWLRANVCGSGCYDGWRDSRPIQAAVALVQNVLPLLAELA